MAAKTDAAPLVVKESFVGNVGGADIQFRKGDPIKADHPAVKKWPQFFGEPELRYEQATAAPGEKRGD